MIFGNEIFDSTVKHMCTEFNTNVDRLSINKVRKNFTMNNVLVHVDMELFLKGIICVKESGEVSLKSAICKLLSIFNCATIEMEHLIVSIWSECGYFYLFYSQAMDTDGFTVYPNRGGSACVVRFDTIFHLYKALMSNIPKEDESGWFEIRKCDITLTPIKAKVPYPTFYLLTILAN